MSIKPKEIVRTKRKTIALVVNSDAELIIRAPFCVDEKIIQGFIDLKKDWIISKQKQIKTFNEKYSKRTFVEGETLLFLGSNYTVEYGNVDYINIEKDKILVPKNVANSKIMIINWYRYEAKNILKERLNYYADLIGVEYKSFNISEAQTRWGSCGFKNTINLSWRLVMCPISVIDYVVIHELSHIKYKNHSKEFWIRVKTIMPNFNEQQKWLEQNKKIISIL